jgi:hypothetical protein
MNGSDVPERRWTVTVCKRCGTMLALPGEPRIGYGICMGGCGSREQIEVMPVEDHEQVVAAKDEQIRRANEEIHKLEAACDRGVEKWFVRYQEANDAANRLQADFLTSEKRVAGARAEMERRAAQDFEAEREYRERARTEPHRAEAHRLNAEMHGSHFNAFREAAQLLTATPCSDQGGDASADRPGNGEGSSTRVTGGGPESDGGLAPETSQSAVAIVVDFLDGWRFCPVSEAPNASRSCLEDATAQLLGALDVAPEPSSSDQEGEGSSG